MTNEAEQSVQVAVQWLPPAAGAPVTVNQFLIQGGPPVGQAAEVDGVFLTLGTLVPPYFSPDLTPEQIQQFVVNPPVALVTPVGQFFLTMDRMRELRDHINSVLDAVDRRDKVA